MQRSGKHHISIGDGVCGNHPRRLLTIRLRITAGAQYLTVAIRPDARRFRLLPRRGCNIILQESGPVSETGIISFIMPNFRLRSSWIFGGSLRVFATYYNQGLIFSRFYLPARKSVEGCAFEADCVATGRIPVCLQ
jgi:hypothetical protein